MKRLTWFLLCASLAVNATLVVALGRQRPKSVAKAVPARDAHDAREKTASVASAATAAARSTAERPLWERLWSRDPATFEANLRRAGFNVGARRGAVYALLRDLQTPERTRAVESIPASPYWDFSVDPAGSLQYSKEITRLWHERDRIMRKLFPEEQLGFTLRMQARFGPLAEEKLEKLSQLDRDYGEMRMQLSQAQSRTIRMPWHAAEVDFLEAEKRKDIAALLTPQEREEYDLRNSDTSWALQRQLAAFHPTEEEYRAIFRVRAAHDQTNPREGQITPALLRERQTQLDTQMRSLLGEARYADYQRATDSGVMVAHSIAQQLNLPPNTANAVYQLQGEVRERAGIINASADQTQTQRDAQLNALAAETRERLTTLLTARGVDQYRLETGGRALPLLERTYGHHNRGRVD